MFNLGDGVDIICDYQDSDYDSRADRIVFGEGITAESITLEKNGNSLVINYSDTDCVTVEDAYRSYYGDGNFEVENVDFADGTKAKIDYQNVSLEITYKPEIIEEEESIIDIAEEIYVSIVNNDTVVSENVIEGTEESVMLDPYIESDIDKMANLMVQEMSGISEWRRRRCGGSSA